jgi:hypothetical protein
VGQRTDEALTPAHHAGMSHPPFFHEASDAVRFWVLVEEHWVGATISRTTLHYRFRPHARDEDPLETYNVYSQEIDAAVRLRVAAGSIEPVMLREYDLSSKAGMTPALGP